MDSWQVSELISPQIPYNKAKKSGRKRNKKQERDASQSRKKRLSNGSTDTSFQITPNRTEADCSVDSVRFDDSTTLSVCLETSVKQYSKFVAQSDLHSSILDEFVGSNSGKTGSNRISKADECTESFLNTLDKTKKYTPSTSLVHCAPFDGDKLVVVIGKGYAAYFHGYCKLSVVYGTVEILGHRMSPGDKSVDVFSPRSAALLSIKNLTNLGDDKDVVVKDINPAITVPCNSALLLCNVLTSNSILFIERHISQQIFPLVGSSSTVFDHTPRISFTLQGMCNLTQLNPEWDAILTKIIDSTRMIVCGGKGVGKSTFLRFCINRLLQKFPVIKFIDLDPGQSEFSVPGVISIFEISEPVLGPNYTHLKKPVRSLLSNINITSDPHKYIKTVRQLMLFDSANAPTLINYMGFNHGIGLNILASAVAVIRPTDLLEIRSNNPRKNYKFHLTPDVITQNAKFFCPDLSDSISYNWHDINSMCDDNVGWMAEPRQLREMCVLSYFGAKITDSIRNSNLFHYEIELCHIEVINSDGQIIPPFAVNAGLVALCSIESELPCLCRCFGWGIVRGVDLTAQTLVLLTPEKIDDLLEVTHLVANDPALPPSVYMTPDSIMGHIPYVMGGTLHGLGVIPKRSYLSIKS